MDSRTFDAAPEVSLADAADEIVFFEKAGLAPPGGWAELGATLPPQMRSWFQPRDITLSVRNYRLSDVVLDGGTLVLRKDGTRIADTAYFVTEDEQAAALPQPEPMTGSDTGETSIIGFNRLHGNYAHWLTQCLPAIDWSVRCAATDRLRLVLPPLNDWQQQTLRLLGYDTLPRLVPEPGRHYRLARAEYSQFLNGSTSFGVCRSVLATARRLLAAAAPEDVPCEIVYIAKTTTYHGQLTNERALIQLLQRCGAHVINPRYVDLQTRMSLLRSANVVIGAHDEGMAEIMFCRPGTLVWELLPAHLMNAAFCRLAQTAELDYRLDVFPSDDTRDWEIDLAVVEARMASIKQHVRRCAASQVPFAAPALDVVPDDQPPLDQVMLAFQNLGDNCEFGIAQRAAGVEPIGLLRFFGFAGSVGSRLSRLVAAVEEGFARLAQPGSMALKEVEERGQTVVYITERTYGMFDHIPLPPGGIDAERRIPREMKRLQLLRRKFQQDVTSGRYIWVWRSAATKDAEQLTPLCQALRAHGPNTLLWVVEADAAHAPGTVERLNDHLLKGYIERFAPYDDATNITPRSWLQVCQNAYALWTANQ